MAIKFIKPVEDEPTLENVPLETIQNTSNETPSIGANDIIKQVGWELAHLLLVPLSHAIV